MVKRDKYKKIKKAQVTIFIILALAIVFILILLFLRRDIAEFITGKSPIEQIKECIEDYTQEAVDILSVQGGSLEPEFYYSYKGERIEYLCYTEENYKRCVMQKPFLKQSIEKEIEAYATSKVKACMANVKTDLEKGGYDVRLGGIQLDAELVPKNIMMEVKGEFTISKGGVESYKSIKTDINSGLYDLVMITSSILNWEARYGDSESTVYMTYYPSIRVEKKVRGDGTTLYILTDKNTGEVFRFASKSMIIPPGITGN